MCRECHAKGRAATIGDAGTPAAGGASAEKIKVAGAWICSMCGMAITSLPFTPRDTSNLKCLDCFKKSRA